MIKNLISVIIPTYNRADLLNNAIKSVQQQEYQNWELIIVDDNSTDNTQSIVEAYSYIDDRIYYLKNDKYYHSAAGARKKGLERARGEYVSFLDSDDTWPSYHLHEHLQKMQENIDIDWIFGDIKRLDSYGNTIVCSRFLEECKNMHFFQVEKRDLLFVLQNDHLIDKSLQYNLITVNASLIKLNIFNKINFREEVEIGEDRLLVLEAIQENFKIAYVEKIHLFYLLHDENISGARQEKSLEHELHIAEKMQMYWQKYLPQYVRLSREQRKIIRENLSHLFVWSIAYNIYRRRHYKIKSLIYIWKGLRINPFNLKFWKTFITTLIFG